MSAKVIIANDEEKDKQIAKLEAACDDYKKAKKAMENDHEKEVAKLKADHEVFQEPGPVVKAIIAGMDEDHKEEAKARVQKAMDEEKDEHAKASIKKAMEEIFETGNGTNKNAMDNDHEKEEVKAVIASLSAKVSEPIIKKILTAKTKAGATEDDINSELKRLAAMTLPQIEKEYKSNEIFINQQLTAKQVEDGVESLTAAEEKEFDFNGVHGALTGKSVDIDAIVEEATL